MQQPNSNKPGRKANRHIWRWVLGGSAALLLGFGLISYLRFANFKDATFGARNEQSLLEATPTATAAPPPTVPATAAPVRNASTAAPLPTSTPLPTATPQPAAPIIGKIQRGERFSLMVLGYGGGNHDGAYLTDTILQVVYDPAKKVVTMVSIPRDMYVFVPYGDNKVGFWGKANSAFAYIMNLRDPRGVSSRYRFSADDENSKIDSAAILTKDVVEQITGIPIDYWMVVSFEGFRKLIDAIGGIDVNVEIAFDDYEYPANDDPQVDASIMHIHFNAGMQHMNGEKAIQYSRSRKSLQDGSDFGRSKRQMKVIQAVKEQALRPTVLFQAYSIMDALQGNIRTSLPFDDGLALANFFNSADGRKITNNLFFLSQVIGPNFLYDSSNEAGYVLIPQAGAGNYKPIREWLRAGLEAPLLRAENLRVQIKNATGNNKYATDAVNFLNKQGITTVPPIWANLQPTTEIIDYTDGKGVENLRILQTLFPDANVTAATPPFKGYTGPELVVVLGKDYIEVAESRNSVNISSPPPTIRQESYQLNRTPTIRP